jgi:MFS family permease
MWVTKPAPFIKRSKSHRGIPGGAGPGPGGPGAAEARRGRGRLALFAERDFRVFYVGYATSLFGSAMAPIAINFALLDRGVGPAGLGYVLAAGVIPQVLFMVGGGVAADRLGRRRVMLTTDASRMAVQAVLAALLFTGSPPVWAFVLLAALRGTGEAFFTPGLGGLRAEIASSARLPDANALLAVAQSGAMVIGPALAGTLIAALSPAVVIAVDAATYGASVLALSLLRVPAARRGTGTARRDLAESWAQLRAHSWLCVTTLQWSLLNLLTYGPYLLLGPVMAQQYLGGARTWGIVIGTQAAGAVLMGLLLVGRRPRRPLLMSRIGTVAVPLPCLVLALHGPAVAVAAAACTAGAGLSLSGTFASTVTQQHVPAAMLSRITALTVTGSFALGSVGLAVVGPVAAALGSARVLGFAAAWGLASGLVVCCLPMIRAVRWQSSESSSDAD